MPFPPRARLSGIPPILETPAPELESLGPLPPSINDDFVMVSAPVRDETDRWAALLDHMRQTRELQQRQAPRLSPPPEIPAGLDIHRRDADRDTRASVENMLAAFGVPTDPEGVINELRASISTQFPRDPDDQDAVQVQTHALRTLSADRRSPTSAVEGEEWRGISDPLNTYYVGAAARESLLALNVCACLYNAINSLPAAQREGARTMFVSALAAAQQRDFSGDFSHVCAPGQFQLMATFLQHYFPQHIHVVPSIKAPRDYVRQLFDDVERNFGRVYRDAQDPNADWILPASTHSAVRQQALAVWDDARRTEKSLEQRSYLARMQVHHRSVELHEGISKLLQFYGVHWTRPKAPSHVEADDHQSTQPLKTKEHLVLRIPSPPRADHARTVVGPQDPHKKFPEQEARRICAQFKSHHPENRPNDTDLNAFYCQAMDEGRVEFADRPEMAKFDNHLRTFLQWEYDFIPVV